MNFETLVDQIDEASVVPDAWHGVLDRLADVADAEGTVPFAISPGKPRWLASRRRDTKKTGTMAGLDREYAH